MSSNTEIATSKVLLDGQQAEDEIKRLSTLATDLKKKLRLAIQNGDEAGSKALKKQLTDVEKEAAAAKRELNSVSAVMKNLNGSSLKQLQGAQRQLNAEIRTSTRNTEEEVTALKLKKQQYSAINAEINKVKAGMTANSEGRLGSLITKAQLAYFAVAAAIGAVVGFARSAYKAYEEQEIANKRLLFSLQGNKTAYFELTKQAGELQKRLGIPDETINQIQMLAAETGKSTSQIKKITEAAIELSLATGEDLQSSYIKLNATFTGSAGRLGRLDADFTKLSKTQLENGAAIDLVLSKYGGLAEKSVSPIKTLTVAWDEFKESIGSSGSSLEPLFNILTDFVYLLGESVKSVRQIKAEVSQDNSSQDVLNALEEIQMTKDKLVKKGMSEKLADQKAYDIYMSTQKTTLAAAQERDLNYLVEYTTLSGKAKDEHKRKIKANDDYIKSINDEIEGVKKSRAIPLALKENPDEAAKLVKEKAEAKIKEQEAAYKLQLDIQKQAIDSGIALMHEGAARELAELKAKYDAEKELLKHEYTTNEKLTPTQKTTLENTAKNIDKKYANDKKQIEQKPLQDELTFQKELIDLKLTAVQEGTFGEYNLKKEQIENNRQLELAGVKETGENKAALVKAINEKYANEQALLDENKNLAILSQNFYKEASALVKAHDEKRRLLKQEFDKGKLTKKQYNDQLFELDSQYERDILAVAVREAQSKIDILKATGIASVKELQQAQDALDAAVKSKVDNEAGKGKTPEKGKGFKDMTPEEKAAYALNAASTVADGIFQIERDNNQRILDSKLSYLEKQRAGELDNKNLTEKQKEDINKAYDIKARKLKADAWQKQHRADVIQSVVKGALGVLTGLAEGGPPGAIIAGIIAAIEIATVSSQKVPEFAKGRYNVTGAQTGKQYNNIPYAGPAVTGLYTHPALVGETGAEMIIDPHTTRNIMMNYPEILEAINNSRVNQFAVGRYPEKSVNTSDINASKILNTELLSILKGTKALLQKIDSEGIKAKSTWTLFDLEKIQKDKRSIEESTDM